MLRKHLSALSAAALLLAACGSETAEPVVEETAEVSVDWTKSTLPELVAYLEAGEVTSEALVMAYLQRIDAVDESGPKKKK